MNFGLVCISTAMQEAGYRFQTMTRAQFLLYQKTLSREKALDMLSQRIYNNLNVTAQTIRYCGDQGVAGYRLSSALFPLITDPTLNIVLKELPDYRYIQQGFADIKDQVEWTGVRISLHPDQWNVLPSLNPATVEQTIIQLNFFGWMMDKCGAARSHWNPINLHVGLSGKEDDSLQLIHDRFMKKFRLLDESVQSRLTLENDDKGKWNAATLYWTFKHTGIPLCFDSHHHAVNPSPQYPYERHAYLDYVRSWDCDPIFHYSESEPGNKNLKAHAEMPIYLPKEHKVHTGPKRSIYWDIELKGKDKAIAKLNEMCTLKA